MTLIKRPDEPTQNPNYPGLKLIDANMDLMRQEREQARMMVAQGQELISKGQQGIHRCDGAEIVLNKLRVELLIDIQQAAQAAETPHFAAADAAVPNA